jgi:hypothetical protein
MSIILYLKYLYYIYIVTSCKINYIQIYDIEIF